MREVQSESAGPNLVACFDLPSLWFGVNPDLKVGETVSARQRYPDCEVESPWSTPVVVDPLAPVPVPAVDDDLCAGETSVTVCGLKAGAHVRITIAPMLSAGPPADKIHAYAIGCGLTSDKSAEATVNKLGRLRPPKVVDPLYACENSVKVVDVVPGTWVDICIHLLLARPEEGRPQRGGCVGAGRRAPGR